MEHPIGPGEMKRDVEDGGSIATCRICFGCDVDEDDDLISPCMCKGTLQFVHRSCLDHWRSVMEGFAFSHCTTCKAQFHFRVNESEENSWRKIKFRLFVARDLFIVFLALQTVIGVMGGLVYLADKHGYLRYLFHDSSDLITSSHPIPICYCIGAFVFFALLGFFGIIRECFSCNNHDRMECCKCCCRCPVGGGLRGLSHGSSSGYPNFSTFGLMIVITMSIFAAFGILFAILAATVVIQRIWQRHYHILAKRSLTQEYVMEDLHGCYTPPKLDPKHEERLKKLNLF